MPKRGLFRRDWEIRPIEVGVVERAMASLYALHGFVMGREAAAAAKRAATAKGKRAAERRRRRAIRK